MTPNADVERDSRGNIRWPLHGWDDEKVYFWSDEHGEMCVSDDPQLMQELVDACTRYFEARGWPKKS